MIHRRILLLILISVTTLLSNAAHARLDLRVGPQLDLTEDVGPLEAGDGILRDDGTFIIATSGPGSDGALLFYPYNTPPDGPVTVPVPGTTSPGIVGNFEDPGLPGDANTVILVEETQNGAEFTTAGPSLPSFAPAIADALEEAYQELASFGCQVFKVSYDHNATPAFYPEEFQLLFDFDFVDEENEILGVSPQISLFFVHCSDRTNYVLALRLSSDRGRLAVSDPFVSLVSSGTQGAGQGALTTSVDPLPLADLPQGASALTRQAATVAVYPAQPVAGNSGFGLPTIAWFGPDGSIADWLQIEGHDVGFSSELALCGSHFSEALWLAYTDRGGNAKLIRIVRPGSVEVFDLGPTSSATVMDCDYWGNVMVAWVPSGGDAINVRAYGPTADEPSSVQIALDGQRSGPLVISMNSNGESALLYSVASGTFIQRIEVDNVVDIDLSFAGSWYSPWFQGEGFIWDISEIDGIPTLALFYFTFLPDGSGRQAWAVGSAEIVNGVANIEAFIGEGGIFGSAYDPDDVTLNVWGNIEVRVLGCRRALMTMSSPEFGEHAYPIQKFTNSPLGLDGLCPTGSAAMAEAPANQGESSVDGSYTGAWFTPERAFEGFILDVTETNGQPTLVVYWFSYITDGSGRPLWLIGSAPFDGNTASMDLLSGSGPTFGPDFDPASVMLQVFGSITVTFNGCNSATISYSVEGGESGSFNVERLASLPPGVGGSCGS